MIKLSEIVGQKRTLSEQNQLKDKAISIFKKDKNRIARSAAWNMLVAGGDPWIDTHKDDIILAAINQIEDDPDLATKMFGQELVSTLLKLKYQV